MKVFIPCRNTLGDVLSGYFCLINHGRHNLKTELLRRLRNACRDGACTSVFAVSPFDFWEALDFPVKSRPAMSFDVPLPENGWNRDELDGHINLLRSPQELLAFPADPPVTLPTRQPHVELPSSFILFSDGAGTIDRGLVDRRIIDWLQLHLPVVRIGSSTRHYQLPMGPARSTAAAMDLTDRTTLCEVFWLAARARLIVSPCTYLRTMSALFGAPVLELLEVGRAPQTTISRTIKEYCGLEYGMRPGEKNLWCFWDGRPSAEARQYVERFVARR
jgi:hypothetical protein